MMISTKGRYALRVMVDLADHNDGSFIPLNDIAERQGISEKYLESIVSSLSKAKIVESIRGKGGGYRLNRPLEEYTVAEILNCTEGEFAPVSCLSTDENECERRNECPTLSMWKNLQDMVNNYFENVTIRNLVESIKKEEKE